MDSTLLCESLLNKTLNHLVISPGSLVFGSYEARSGGPDLSFLCFFVAKIRLTSRA